MHDAIEIDETVIAIENIKRQREEQVAEYLQQWRYDVRGKYDNPPYFWLGAEADPFSPRTGVSTRLCIGCARAVKY